MEWVTKLNEAISYIEENIKGKIDYAAAARIACCSLTRFQRTFSLISDTTIGDYVRYRKMALAADELKSSSIKVIDLALKYGYDSPDSFTRAFQKFHGMSPTTVRKLGLSKPYPAISFQININGGNVYMGKKPVVQIEEFVGKQVVSFFVDQIDPEKHAWNLMRTWVKSNIKDYSMRRYIGCAPKGHHPQGEQHKSNEGPVKHEYYAQMILFDNEDISDLCKDVDICAAPQGLFLIGDIIFNEFHDDGTIDIGTSMQKSSQIMFDCMNEIGGYELDFNHRCFYEEHIFTKEWFYGADEMAEMKLWLPIKKM
ncbi:AraC family transcriptional regulator [Tissierella carlieri]|uniref:AraC family transcriptional regulator n=1 Tax=Tissierella carlieri TaxID=689904 RepID=A0ABT1S7Z4_9FIRM|nr:AraC family transcriptional regulator [Tissierella carlieri]MCQ4922589.1 AraC family transcriptional regulator [Tissierella carlieri]